MHKLVKLNKDKTIIYNKRISEYLNPEFLYVPVEKGYQLLVKNNEIVLKGQVIMENNLKKIISPISGTILEAEKQDVDGYKCNTIKIANNYAEKEKMESKQKGFEKTKTGIVNKLYKYSFDYIAEELSNKKIDNLIINAIDDEPYILTKEILLSTYSKEVLELLDVLTNAFNINKAIIAIKSSNTDSINSYLSKLGTYPNIELSLQEDKYLIGKNVFLLESLHLKDSNSLIIDINDLIYMYDALKYDKKRTTSFITVGGPGVEKSKVIKVKLGTLLSDIIENKIKPKKDSIFILNGLMTGKKCDINHEIVTNNTLGIIAIVEEKFAEEKCNNCGLCYKVCPVKINPKKSMDKKEKSKACLDCGLCSYICPMHINLRKFLRGEHE